MGVFDRFERRLERLVEGAFGRVFKGEAAPVDIARALQRETDDRKVIVGPRQVIAPNEFVVAVGDHDHTRLGPYSQPLSEAFAEMLHAHAKQAGYSFAGPVRVELEHDPALDTGRFSVRSDPASARGPAGPPGSPAEAAALPPVAAPPNQPVHRLMIASTAPDANGKVRSEGQQNVPLVSPVTVLGRGADADVHLADPGVSRRHAELHLRGNRVRLLDAGSTNGTTVNGTSVREHELRSGDRIQVGNTVLVYRATD